MLLLILVGLYVLFLCILYLNQRNIVFVPSGDLVITPDLFGSDYQEEFLEVAHGERIHLWYFTSSTSSPTVLFSHGNAGNMSHRASTIELLISLGCNVLIFDYRGYGQSDGIPSEENAYADADACYRWLTESRHVPPSRLFLMGRSLGSAVAIDLAVKRKVAGLIVESSFTSIQDLGQKMYPFLPIKYLIRYHFNSIAKIDSINCPLLVCHSPDDNLIPYKMSRELFNRAQLPKEFITLFGGHNDPGYMSSDEYLSGLRRFLFGNPGPE
jgi:fermentation-respiration switch protein FrsA (DUF1100 family)